MDETEEQQAAVNPENDPDNKPAENVREVCYSDSETLIKYFANFSLVYFNITMP
jgi:hypothetical protein